jgi:hypothetical protein
MIDGRIGASRKPIATISSLATLRGVIPIEEESSLEGEIGESRISLRSVSDLLYHRALCHAQRLMLHESASSIHCSLARDFTLLLSVLLTALWHSDYSRSAALCPDIDANRSLGSGFGSGEIASLPECTMQSRK